MDREMEWHDGQLAVQEICRSGNPDPMRSTTALITPGQTAFLDRLDFFALSSLDSEARPWCSVVGGEMGIVKVAGPDTIRVNVAGLSKDDPFQRNIHEKHPSELSAGLGIDFRTRRRLKVISAKMEQISTESLYLTGSFMMGNCPKYIHIRDLYKDARGRIETMVEWNANKLTQECLDLISKCDTLFLASCDSNFKTMDCNHRGGPRGFVRVKQGDSTILVLPDYSGNRFFQTLGNVQSYPKLGLTFVDFETGSQLFVTGIAKNLFGNDAKEWTPRHDRITIVDVTGYVLIANGPIRSREYLPSPYTPPVRFLADEEGVIVNPSIKASWIETKELTDNVSTFVWKLQEPVLISPGQSIILDFSSMYSSSFYRHMADDNPQCINDDHVRTWTVTSFPPIGEPTDTFEITVKKIPNGAVSNILHSWKIEKTQPFFRGLTNPFGPFQNGMELVSSNLLFVMGGIGITPFLACWSKLKDMNVDVALMFSTRGEEVNLISNLDKLPNEYRLFFTKDASEAPKGSMNRRITKQDLEQVSKLGQRTIYICGPNSFNFKIKEWLHELEIPPEQIYSEDFY